MLPILVYTSSNTIFTNLHMAQAQFSVEKGKLVNVPAVVIFRLVLPYETVSVNTYE